MGRVRWVWCRFNPSSRFYCFDESIHQTAPPPGAADYCFRAVRLHLAVVCRQCRAARVNARCPIAWSHAGGGSVGGAAGIYCGDTTIWLAPAGRLAPARLFLLCAVAGSLTNAALLLPGGTPGPVLGTALPHLLRLLAAGWAW